MATLYRKYRPQNFKEVVGQNHIKITLQNEIQAGKIAQAYIFCGPRAVGKTTLARVFSKAINCAEQKESDYEPCNKCNICQEITEGRSLDIIEIDAASHTGVDNVRDNIIATARTSPSKLKYKVFIIDEVHMLSISAFNALLKIIEEPPEQVIFILCTTEIHKVPKTIISRCQRFDFKRIGIIDAVKKLDYIAKKENINIEKNILENIARQADGYMRDAESLLEQIVAIGGDKITQKEADLVIPRSDIKEIIELISALTKKDSALGISLVNTMIDNGVDLKKFTEELIEIMRKILLSKININLVEKLSLELGESLQIKLNEVSKDLSIERLLILIEKFIDARNELKTSYIPQLPLEIAIAELCLAPATENISNTIKSAEVKINNIVNKPVNNPVSNSTNNIQNNSRLVTKEEIVSKWNEVLARIKKYNHSLSFILRACEPKKINGSQLCLGFRYKFHKDRINDQQIKIIVEKVLHEVYGTPLLIEAIIDENIAAESLEVKNDLNIASTQDNSQEVKDTEETAENNNTIDNLLKNFGGKVVK